MRRRLTLGLALLCAAVGLVGIAAPSRGAQAPDAASAEAAGLVARGRSLFMTGCSTCHGLDARGRPGQRPSLIGAGAASADFYLSTGRMPLADPHEEPMRAPPAYPRTDIRALVAYVGSLGGPSVPAVHPERGSLREGLKAFTEHCAGCHQVVARGGIAPGAVAPALQRATATQIAEAVRVGPYLMPRFSPRRIDDTQLDSVARYVRSTRQPPDRGGWGIGHIGPIPEGLVAWLLAGVALVLVARTIGERSR